MKYGLISIFCMTLAVQVFGQDMSCGTENSIDPNYDARLFEMYKTSRLQGNRSAVMDTLPLKIHMIRRSNGTGGMSLTALYNEIVLVNDHYANSDMFFRPM